MMNDSEPFAALELSVVVVPSNVFDEPLVPPIVLFVAPLLPMFELPPEVSVPVIATVALAVTGPVNWLLPLTLKLPLTAVEPVMLVAPVMLIGLPLIAVVLPALPIVTEPLEVAM